MTWLLTPSLGKALCLSLVVFAAVTWAEAQHAALSVALSPAVIALREARRREGSSSSDGDGVDALTLNPSYLPDAAALDCARFAAGKTLAGL